MVSALNSLPWLFSALRAWRSHSPDVFGTPGRRRFRYDHGFSINEDNAPSWLGSSSNTAPPGYFMVNPTFPAWPVSAVRSPVQSVPLHRRTAPLEGGGQRGAHEKRLAEDMGTRRTALQGEVHDRIAANIENNLEMALRSEMSYSQVP